MSNRVLHHSARRLAVALAVILAPLAWQADARADTLIAEQVVARVDGHPVLLSEIRALARPRLTRLAGAGPMERVRETQKIYAELLEQRIEEEVVRSLAAVLHAAVTDAELTATLETMATDQHTTPEVLLRTAVEAGFTVGEFRRELRRQLLRQKVVFALGLRDKSGASGAYPRDDAGRTAWFARVESGLFAAERSRACVERWVRW